MTSVVSERMRPGLAQRQTERVTSVLARSLFIGVLMVATAAGVLSTTAGDASLAVSHSGADLARLLRFMAVLKAGMAVAAAAAVFWRFGSAVTLPRFTAYALAAGAMASGPGLIWGMVHVGVGAMLLHGGLLATGLLLWRDPAVTLRLEAIIRARVARRGPPKPPRRPASRPVKTR